MDILKVISHLMTYPSSEVAKQTTEIVKAIDASREISPEMRQRLKALVNEIYSIDLMDAQEAYTGLFDRGRALSLLLFEHVHGESRDRGQAMVDLMSVYESKGFEIAIRELPDYIPLYLEYLSQCPQLEAREGLADVSHIFGLLSARLGERESSYAALFDALLMISGVNVDIDKLRTQAAGEKPDNTLEELDKIWEEEAVTFGAGDALGSGCSTSSKPSPKQTTDNDPVAVRWTH